MKEGCIICFLSIVKDNIDIILKPGGCLADDFIYDRLIRIGSSTKLIY
jgi:hypothetical protein